MLDDDLLQEEAAGEEKERQDMKLAALRVGGGGNASYLRMKCKSSPHSTSFLIPQPPSPNLSPQSQLKALLARPLVKTVAGRRLMAVAAGGRPHEAALSASARQ